MAQHILYSEQLSTEGLVMTANKLQQYGHQFQIKVLYSLLNDKMFLQKIVDVLTLDYFESPAHKWIVEIIISYYSKYHTYPTMEVLKVEIKKVENEILRLSIKEELKQVYTTTHDEIEYVKEEFFNFCKNQRLKEALLSSVELLSGGEYEGIRKLIDDALKACNDKNIGHEYDKDIESRFRVEEDKKIPFPWKVFNDITDGGIGTGNLMLLFAPPGIGKSTVVCAMAVHAIKLGYKVVYYTLELDDRYVGKKIDSILTGIDMKQLKNHRKEIEKAIENIPGKIVIKEFSPGKASMDTIESHLRQLEANNDFFPDLIIIDYPDLLKPRRTRKETTQELDDIYVDVKALAKDNKIPVVCPAQINRMGAKDEIIEGDKVAGNFSKMMIADFSVSLSRRRKDKIQGTGRFHVMKSRLGGDGMTYSAKIDLNRGHIEISEEQYDEDTESTSDGSGSDFSSDEMNKLRKRFIKA
jgi:replicative DNA helicase